MDLIKWQQLSAPPIEKVVVQSVVLLSIVENYYRVAKDTRKRVVGLLLGSSFKGTVDVTYSYAVPFEENDEDPSIWFLDHNYLQAMFSILKRINAKEHVVGWYSIGPKLRENDVDVHGLLNEYVPDPVLVIIDVQPKELGISTKAYYAIEEVKENATHKSQKVFVHVPSEIAAHEAEEIGIEHLRRDVMHTITSTLVTECLELRKKASNFPRDRMETIADKTIVGEDTISSLPDDLAARIVSFLGAKQAVETSLLSSKWRYIWTKMPHLNFSSEVFSTFSKFFDFFMHVMSSCRKRVDLSLHLHGNIDNTCVQTILKHAFSQNLQKLTFKFFYQMQSQFSLSLFSSWSLKHLTLVGVAKDHRIIPTSMWELPALTTLHLEYLTLSNENSDDEGAVKCVILFSKLTNLRNLTIKSCGLMGSSSYIICHPQLSDLTLTNKWCQNVVKVVAPLLKSLTIVNWDGELWISAAPDLTSLLYENHSVQLALDIDSLASLEKVGLFISHPFQAGDANRVAALLQKFRHVKFLTISLKIIELLSSSVEAISRQPSPFVNLKSLKIDPELNEEADKKLTMSTEIKNYLLGTSPRATFTMVTGKEVRALRDAELAQNLIAQLRVFLDQEKALGDKKGRYKRPQPMEKRVAGSIWVDLHDKIDQKMRRLGDISLLVASIKDLQKKLPASINAELEENLCSLVKCGLKLS